MPSDRAPHRNPGSRSVSVKIQGPASGPFEIFSCDHHLLAWSVLHDARGNRVGDRVLPGRADVFDPGDIHADPVDLWIGRNRPDRDGNIVVVARRVDDVVEQERLPVFFLDATAEFASAPADAFRCLCLQARRSDRASRLCRGDRDARAGRHRSDVELQGSCSCSQTLRFTYWTTPQSSPDHRNI